MKISNKILLATTAVATTTILCILLVLLCITTSTSAAHAQQKQVPSCNFNFNFVTQTSNTPPPIGSRVSLSEAAAFYLSASSINNHNGDPLVFRSADFFLHSNNTKITEAYLAGFTNTTTGFDTWGEFNEQKINFALTSSNINTPDFGFAVRLYPSQNNNQLTDKIVFRQEFYSELPQTQNNKDKNILGDTQQMSTSFPSFHLYNEEITKNDPIFGFYHFAGFMSGSMYPSSGNSGSFAASQHLYGGIRNASVITFFTESVSTTISPASEFVAASLEGYSSSSSNTRQVRWGINGNANSIPAGYSVDWMLKCTPSGSVNTNMRSWGKELLKRYGKSTTNAHDRDITLQTLGYSTDNGAGAYYLNFPMQNPLNPKETFKNYQDYFVALKKYSVDNNIPYRWAELDSWWYYRGGKGPWGLTNGLLNWTAKTDIFPDGLATVHNFTGWSFQLHNRYFAPDNVYASNPLSPIGPTKYEGKKFPFVYSKQTGNGVPQTAEFWEYFFSIKENTGGASYIQDWISFVFDQVEELTTNVTFGLDWLKGMARGADVNDWSIQYCMSYPRAVLSSVMFRSVTQARASNDYQPQSTLNDYYQWRIGDSSLFAESIGLSPAKDNFWTSSKPQYTPHYDPLTNTVEYRNRLESAVASLSNSIVAIGDALGYSDRELIMRSCNSEGRLLRPSQAATPLDSWFVYKAYKQFNQHTPKQVPRANIVDPVIHFTFSNINAGQLQYFYLMSVNNGPNAVSSVAFDDLLQSAGYFYPTSSSSSTAPSSFLAWETNSSASNTTFFDGENPLILNERSDEITFEYFTLVPLYPWMSETTPASSPSFITLLGEPEKWISASEQRIKRIMYSSSNNGFMRVHVDGGVGEIVTLVFALVDKNPVANGGKVRASLRLSCKIGSEQVGVFNVENAIGSLKGSCDYY